MQTTDATLTGSDKQVAWALGIRNAVMANLGNARRHGDLLDEAYEMIVAALDRHTSAAWWIDSLQYEARTVPAPQTRPDLPPDPDGEQWMTCEREEYGRKLRAAIRSLHAALGIAKAL